MPRSNKKKTKNNIPTSALPFLEPPLLRKKQKSNPDPDVSNLLSKEKTLMISRTIQSAQKHGINLRHGSSNPGTGDCAFEAVIQNVNDRPHFTEKFSMSIDWYRRTWTTDMANRTIYTHYNTLTNKEWLEGWKDMQTPGTYERGIFGDLMLPGIACGIRKYLLIFNTNVNTPHDPIYIIDPSIFNVIPDNKVPVVLSYNMTHYESMEPCTEVDVKMTTDLVQQYLSGRYHYTKQDIPYLISSQDVRREDKLYIDISRSKIMAKNKEEKMAQNLAGDIEKNSQMKSNSANLEAKNKNGDQKKDDQYSPPYSGQAIERDNEHNRKQTIDQSEKRRQ